MSKRSDRKLDELRCCRAAEKFEKKLREEIRRAINKLKGGSVLCDSAALDIDAEVEQYWVVPIARNLGVYAEENIKLFDLILMRFNKSLEGVISAGGGLFSVQTRCAVYKGFHSCWAYGPMYISKAAAQAAGHTHKVECASCGRTDRPL